MSLRIKFKSKTPSLHNIGKLFIIKLNTIWNRGKHLKGKLIWLDVIFYLAIPLGIWHFGKDMLGDYAAMLLSTVPGLLYTIYRFFLEKQFNITGLFIIITLALSTSVNLIAGSAERMLVYSIYCDFAMGLFYLFTVIIKKPIVLYFFIDVA